MPQTPRLLHTMLRVHDLKESLAFYCDMLDMRLLRKNDYPAGRFTLAFVGYKSEADGAVLELTHNWDTKPRRHGSMFGHIAIGVENIATVCVKLEAGGVAITRAPGPMAFKATSGAPDEVIAFIKDPDGYAVELIEKP